MIIAIVTITGTLFSIDRNGDAQSSVSEADRKLSEIPAAIQRHTYERKASNSEKPTDKTRALYEVSVPNGETFTVEGPNIPLTANGEQIAWDLRDKSVSKKVDFIAVWDEVSPIWGSLTYNNKKIAEAKAMLFFDSKPSAVTSYDWENRFHKSKETWHIQESRQYFSTLVLYSLGAGTLAFIAALSVLMACGWLWRALLARIRELSNAFRGK